ncbi:MAG: alpha/beta hydrolase [Chloroflexota bacterium]|nr:alpha/beta hydrolase [Dehalococcoidia bacterium]MDW8254043.1 alpha/beta hydrolase [Chloroflexota bacterium]
MRRGYLATSSGLIHYRTAGSGEERLLLLHQTPLSSAVYDHLLPLFAERYCVVAIDTPGYGESDPPPPGGWGIPDYARAVIEALDALGWQRAHLVGRLTGCSVAVEVAAAAPERIQRLVLSGLPDYDEETRQAKLAALKWTPMRPDGSQTTELWRFLRATNPALPTAVIHRMHLGILRPGPRNEEAHRAVFRYDPKTRIPAIEAPTLLLYGERDYFLDRIETLRPLFRRAQLQFIPGGQQLIFENPVGFAGAVLDFLARPLAPSQPEPHTDQ